MARKSRFEEKLDHALQGVVQGVTPFAAARGDLEGIVRTLERRFATGKAHGKLQFRVVPGFQVNIGQQMKVVARIPNQHFEDVLFRAYVLPQGYPVGLDLYGEQPVPCGNAEELENRIVEFISRPEVNDRMLQYRDFV